MLYGAGLRVGEALNLTVADVDLPNALLTVRDTKFFKSRLVPIGPQLAGVLTEYARRRAASHPAMTPESRFFLGRRGAAIQVQTMDGTFERLRDMRGDTAVRRCPLPAAAARPASYLRRPSPDPVVSARGGRATAPSPPLGLPGARPHQAYTQVYLTMTPDLLQQAGVRFERYARGEDDHA